MIADIKNVFKRMHDRGDQEDHITADCEINDHHIFIDYYGKIVYDHYTDGYGRLREINSKTLIKFTKLFDNGIWY